MIGGYDYIQTYIHSLHVPYERLRIALTDSRVYSALTDNGVYRTLTANPLYLALTVSGVTFLVTLTAMGKWRRMTRSIRSIVLRTSSTRSPKYHQIRTEMIESEERHVDVLEFIQRVFCEPLAREALLSPQDMANVFANTKQVLEIHREILQALHSSKKSFEKTIFQVFSGPIGGRLEAEVGLFCTRHKLRGMTTWMARKNEEKIRELLSPELIMEQNPDSPLAKLTLDDHLSAIFQRPLRYPLLLERLGHECRPDSPEGRLIAKTLARSRDIGFNINEQLRRAERLIEIDQKTDRASGLRLDLTDHNLIREDRLTWRVSKQKSVDALLVLTDRVLAILRRESNGRLTYKYHKVRGQSLIGGAQSMLQGVKAGNTGTGGSAKSRHSPCVQLMGDLITKHVATDTNAFFLISTDQDILYELVAPTLNERNVWMEAIAKATANYNKTHSTLTVGRVANAPGIPGNPLVAMDTTNGEESMDVTEESGAEGLPEDFKRHTGARKSWFDSLTKRKSKAANSSNNNTNKRKSNGVKESAL